MQKNRNMILNPDCSSSSDLNLNSGKRFISLVGFNDIMDTVSRPNGMNSISDHIVQLDVNRVEQVTVEPL